MSDSKETLLFEYNQLGDYVIEPPTIPYSDIDQANSQKIHILRFKLELYFGWVGRLSTGTDQTKYLAWKFFSYYEEACDC